ncbi:hypothetical protein [Devosia sp.]|jgi:hypothetical protein|uniref:hypothetical protein n=1 Tax=Devosia sp. TaxID=1871048 RepID=UPI00262A6953|nr:hypothetical protein [Devosia sp.]
MQKDNSAAQKERRSRTHQGRRVTSKTFTILGASTPDFRISTMMTPRKQKRPHR